MTTWRRRVALAGVVAACGWLATPWVAWSLRHRRSRSTFGGYAVPRRAQRQAWYGRPGLTAQWF